MLTVYVVIGILMFVGMVYCVVSTRNIDVADLVIAMTIFGIFWPIGLTHGLFMYAVHALNKLRK